MRGGYDGGYVGVCDAEVFRGAPETDDAVAGCREDEVLVLRVEREGGDNVWVREGAQTEVGLGVPEAGGAVHARCEEEVVA